MFTYENPRIRAAQRFVALPLLLAAAAPGLAAIKSWNAGSGNWTTAGNWSPNGVPGSNDTVRIGNLAGVQDTVVNAANAPFSPDAIEISDGMTLDTGGTEFLGLVVTISGGDSRMIVRPHAGDSAYDFIGEMNIGPGSQLELTNNVPIRVFWDSHSWGRIEGWGDIQCHSLTPFSNGGVINPGNGGLRFEQSWDGDLQPFDLDGTGEFGQVWLTVPYSIFELEASGLADPFDGAISMVSGALLTMNVEDGWRLDSGGVINVNGAIANAAAQINGDDVTLAGTVNVAGDEGILRVLADATVEDSASTYIFAGNRMEFDGANTVNGGWYRVYDGATLDFDGVTTMRGGEFITNSTNPADGVVNFNGSTTWNGGGAVEITGVARQMGNAFVNGPMVINADVFDMDGDGDTQWTVWSGMTIDAESIQADGDGPFMGTINVANGTLGRLTVWLPVWDHRFEMGGEMNLFGHPSVWSTRYDGTTLDLSGDLNVNGLVGFSGYLHAMGGAIDIAAPTAVLRLDAGGLITSACTFSGNGELRISSSPLLVEANLAGVGLVNEGELRLSYSAATDRFRAEPGAHWIVSMRGYEAGETYDQLRVTGGDAHVDGTLEVEFFDEDLAPGGDVFKPEIGDEFTILTATGNVTGQFDANPSNCEEGSVYRWTVRYGPHTVTLRLDAIGLKPGDMNCDCRIDFFDIDPFLMAQFDPAAYAVTYPDCAIAHADVNVDGSIDFFDIDPFLEVLFP